eukprot:3546025-Prymnesium_polylepis.1
MAFVELHLIRCAFSRMHAFQLGLGVEDPDNCAPTPPVGIVALNTLAHSKAQQLRQIVFHERHLACLLCNWPASRQLFGHSIDQLGNGFRIPILPHVVCGDACVHRSLGRQILE